MESIENARNRSKDRRSLLKDAGDNAETASMWIWRRRSECSPGENHLQTSFSGWNGGEDHFHSPVPTTNQADGRNGGEDHPHSLVPTTNQTGCRNGGDNHPHSLVPTTNQANGQNGGEDRLHSLANTTNFYLCTIRVFEYTFASSECAYQFMKAMSHGKVNVAKDIIQARNACDAKRLGRGVITERVWETERLEVMKQIIRR